MKAAPFSVLRPASLQEALAALARYGDDARVLAGGQTLVPMLAMRFANPGLLIDISGLAELGGIAVELGAVRVGANVTQTQLLGHPGAMAAQPLLAAAIPHVAHAAIRNRGTAVGSVCHADPSAELPLVLRVLDGAICLRSARRQRVVPATDFFLGALQTSRAADELAVDLRLPALPRDARVGFAEFGYRHGDFAVVSVAVVLASGRLRMGFGGIDDTPVVVEEAAADTEQAHAALARWAAGLDVRQDPTATAAYRRHLIRGLGGRLIDTVYGAATAATAS